ncbi:MAG TPA: S26 family signal peptidase, partial [Thermoanaerobaculia bacterium]|nr:S26 family signal peptidase [Thermoanaerobaculia bacterium]
MRRSCCSAALLAAVAGLLVLPAMLGPVAPPVLWNLSASVPEGLYLRSGSAPAPGDLVAVCLPEDLSRFARERGYVSRGRCPGGAAPLLKRLAARAGQEVDHQDGSIWIDGRPLAVTTIRQLDRKGRPLPLARAFPYRL